MKIQAKHLSENRRAMKTCPLSMACAVLGQAAIGNLNGATFVINARIGEYDNSFDGQDIVVSGATLTVDGRHSFNSLLLTNGAVLTHLSCTTTNTHKLDLAVPNLSAANGSPEGPR